MNATPDEVFWLVSGGFVAGFACASLVAIYFLVGIVRGLKR